MGTKLKKINDAINFQIGYTETYGEGDIQGTGMVTEVDQENKTITIETSEAPLQPGDEGYVDGKALEAELVEAEKKRLAAEPDQEEVACMMIKLYTPRFYKLVDSLSARECRRVLKSLMTYPLGKDIKHKSGKEEEAFAVGQGLNDARMVLVIKTYNDNKETILEMAAEAAKNTTIEYGNPEGETNGKEA